MATTSKRTSTVKPHGHEFYEEIGARGRGEKPPEEAAFFVELRRRNGNLRDRPTAISMVDVFVRTHRRGGQAEDRARSRGRARAVSLAEHAGSGHRGAPLGARGVLMSEKQREAAAPVLFEVGDFVVWNEHARARALACKEAPARVEAVRHPTLDQLADVGHPQWLETDRYGTVSGLLVDRWQPPRLTAPQRRILLLTLRSEEGVVDCMANSGLTRANYHRMMGRLRGMGLVADYPHGRDEYEITPLGRYALKG